jgi:hypothetical protein
MKCYRKWRLCRRLKQQAQVFILMGFVLTYSLVFFHLSRTLSLDDVRSIYFKINKSLVLPVNCYCSESSLIIFEHGECFFNQRVCHPGFAGSQCEIPLKNEVGEIEIVVIEF